MLVHKVSAISFQNLAIQFTSKMVTGMVREQKKTENKHHHPIKVKGISTAYRDEKCILENGIKAL